MMYVQLYTTHKVSKNLLYEIEMTKSKTNRIAMTTTPHHTTPPHTTPHTTPHQTIPPHHTTPSHHHTITMVLPTTTTNHQCPVDQMDVSKLSSISVELTCYQYYQQLSIYPLFYLLLLEISFLGSIH